MFDFKQKTVAGMTDGEPTPDEMAEQFDKLLHNKHVILKEVCVKVFDTRIEAENAAYCELYKDLYAKVQAKTALVRSVERKFVERPTPTWLIYLEWWVYALEVDGKEVTPEEYDEIKKKDSALSKHTEKTEPPAAQQLVDAGHTEGDNDDGEDG